MDSSFKLQLKEEINFKWKIDIVKTLLELGLITKKEVIEIIFNITPEQADKKLQNIKQEQGI